MSDDNTTARGPQEDRPGDAGTAPENPGSGAPADDRPPFPTGQQQPSPGAPQPGYPAGQQPNPGGQQPYPGGQPPYAGPQQPYPAGQQPYPGAQQPYPGTQQPYPAGQQPYPGAQQPYPGGQPPYGPPQPPKRGLGTGAIIAIVVGGVVVLGVIITVLALFFSHLVAGASGQGGQSSDPSSAVTGYLTALSEGDAETALGYLSSPPDDDTLLTDDVLAASNALAPITQIEVIDSAVDNGSGDITVGYLLGSTPVQTVYSVIDYDDDGAWELSGGTGYLSIAQFDGLGLTINGQEATGDEVEVFPGTYELATTEANFTLSGETTVTVTDPFTSGDTSDIEPVLTDAALQQFRDLVKAAVDVCIASTSLTAGCGLDLPATLDDGTQLTDGTITRTLPADTATTLASLDATLSYDNPTLAQGDYIGSIDVEGQCTQNGAAGTCSVLFGPALGTPSVDMASPDPTVLWD